MGLAHIKAACTVLPALCDDFRLAANPAAPAYEPHLWNDRGWNELVIWKRRFGKFANALEARDTEALDSGNLAFKFRIWKDEELAEQYDVPVPHVAASRRGFLKIADSVLFSTNCYAYANNFRTGFGAGDKMQPGALSNLYRSLSKDNVIEGVIHDGLRPFDSATGVPPDHYLVFLFLHEEKGELKDYHFVRQDKGGTFSHKPGHRPVTNTDNNGTIITDPRKANFSPYALQGAFTRPPSLRQPAVCA